MVPFGIELEMLDDCLHRTLHFATSWWKNLVVLRGDGTLSLGGSKLFDALSHNAYRLAHLLHAHEVAIVTVAMLADRDIEIKLWVAFVRLCLAQIPSRAGAAHHHARKAPGPGVGELDHPDVDIALLENAIFSQQTLEVVAYPEEGIAERPDVID